MQPLLNLSTTLRVVMQDGKFYHTHGRQGWAVADRGGSTGSSRSSVGMFIIDLGEWAMQSCLKKWALECEQWSGSAVGKQAWSLAEADGWGADGVEASVFRCFLGDVSSICLVRECREKEEHFSTSVTDSILCHLRGIYIRAVKIKLQEIDKEITLKGCLEKEPLVADLGEYWLNQAMGCSTWLGSETHERITGPF